MLRPRLEIVATAQIAFLERGPRRNHSSFLREAAPTPRQTVGGCERRGGSILFSGGGSGAAHRGSPSAMLSAGPFLCPACHARGAQGRLPTLIERWGLVPKQGKAQHAPPRSFCSAVLADRTGPLDDDCAMPRTASTSPERPSRRRATIVTFHRQSRCRQQECR